jgi:hypothetical protein
MQNGAGVKAYAGGARSGAAGGAGRAAGCGGFESETEKQGFRLRWSIEREDRP